jgi:hypothetical protein
MEALVEGGDPGAHPREEIATRAADVLRRWWPV